MSSDPKVIVALDFPDAPAVLQFVAPLNPLECRLKIGKELFTATGPALIDTLTARGFDIFLDLKFHDIPNTVASACKVAADLGVWMVNVHALGGRKMMETAREAIGNCPKRPLLIAVTMLTSMDRAAMAEVGLDIEPALQVARLAALAKSSGLDGVVCSAQEATMLKQQLGREFKLVTPGIRPAGSEQGDQSRVMTPAEAIRAGSDYLVIGRPITRAADPVAMLARINSEISAAG